MVKNKNFERTKNIKLLNLKMVSIKKSNINIILTEILNFFMRKVRRKEHSNTTMFKCCTGKSQPLYLVNKNTSYMG